MTYRFTVRLLMITLAAMLVAATYQLMPALRMAYLEPEAEPRVVTARGDLAAEEQATIELFQSARDSVVFISTAERVRGGRGSPFSWTVPREGRSAAHPTPKGTHDSSFVR